MSQHNCGFDSEPGADTLGTEFRLEQRTADTVRSAPRVDALGKLGWSDLQAADTARMFPGSNLLADTISVQNDAQRADTLGTLGWSDVQAADTARTSPGSNLLADTKSVQNDTRRAATLSAKILATTPRRADTRCGGESPGAATLGAALVVRNAECRDTSSARTTKNVNGSVPVTPHDGEKKKRSDEGSNVQNEQRTKQQSLNTRL